MYIDGATCQTRRNDAGQQRCRSVGLSVRQSDDLAPVAQPSHVRPFIHPLLAPELPIALATSAAAAAAVQTDGCRADTSYHCHLVGNRPEATHPHACDRL